MAAPAFVSNHLLHEAENNDETPSMPSAVVSQTAAGVFSAAAIGEKMLDKYPALPNRTDAIPLAARVLSGAVCGGLLSRASGERAAIGALVGAATAAASTWMFTALRASADRAVPDPVVALAEDALVLTAGRMLFTGDNGNGSDEPQPSDEMASGNDDQTAEGVEEGTAGS